jgi:cell division transport system permease protein
MGQAPLVQLLAVSTTAVCMLLLGTVMLVWTNARTVADAWGIDVPVTIYLRDGVSPSEADELAMRLTALPEVQLVDPIQPDEAMERLAAGLGGQEELLEGVDPDILPASLEVRLEPGVSNEFASALAVKISEFDEVDEVAVAGDWVGRAQDMLRTLGDLALGAAALVGLACMAIVWSTIRLAVYARRAEIQILRLVGGTGRFVRGPFIVEGCLQGALGASMAMGLLYLGFDHLRPFIEGGLSLLFAAGALRFFTPVELALGIGFGAAVGLLGSRAATGRYVET